MNILKFVGMTCKKFRTKIGKKQVEVAIDTGYSIENISSFECGRNDSLRIFLWYVNAGLDVLYLCGALEVMKNENI